MKPEQLEKILPLSLLLVFGGLIGLRLIGVLPPFPGTGQFDISLNILINSGIGGVLFVLAMVISVTLMNIQFASQEYSHRVMITYVRSFMLWSMIGIYLVTILYDLGMTASLKEPINPTYTDVSVLLQSLCFIMLVPHFIITVTYLRPDLIIGRIIRTIDQKYLSSVETFLRQGKSQVPSKVDRLLPAVEMIEKSIERGDRATVRVALDDIHACYRKYVKTANKEWASRYFLDYFLRIGRQALIGADDDSMVQVLGILGEIGSSLDTANACQVVIEDINTIGLGALKGDYDVAVEQMIDSLEAILRSTDSGEIANQVFDSYAELSPHLFRLDKKALIRYLVDRLAGLTEIAIKKPDLAIIRKWASVLEEMGRAAITHKLREGVHHTIQAFFHMGTASAKSGVDIAHYVIESLVRMERELDPTDRELISEIAYAKKEIEANTRKYAATGKEEVGIDTSDLWG